MIRRLTANDAEELAAVLLENRAFVARFEPDRDERFYTAEGQRERLEHENHQHSFAILDGERIVGTVALSNVVRGPLQSANLGYWVAEGVSGRGIATNAVGELIPIAFGELGLHRLQAGTLVDNPGFGPNESVTARWTEDNPGRWLYHCHVFAHQDAGMAGWYIVE